MLRRYRHLLSPLHAFATPKVPRPASLSARPVLVGLEDRDVPSAPAAPPGYTATASTFSNTTPVAIVDVGTVTSTVTVSGVGTYLHDVDVFTAITHTFPGDIDMTVRSPAGTVVTITTDNGGTNDNVFNGTLFDDDADPGNPAPFTGGATTFAASVGVTDTVYAIGTVKTTLTPEEALAAFRGENPNGVWTLTLSDDATGDTGSLDQFRLELSTIASGVPETGPVTASFATSTAIPTATATTTAPGVLTTTVTVAGAPTYLQRLTLQTFITHTANDNLDITLTSPAGTSVTITSDNGGANDDVFNGTVWNDDADPASQVPYANSANTVTDAAYANLTVKSALTPEEALGAFIGEDPNGTWTLTTTDDTVADTGNLASWQLNVFGAAPFGTPSASATAPNATAPGTQTITVTYADNTAISTATLGTGDITVTGPGAFTATPTFVSFTGTGGNITATYTLPTPTMNGTYAINVVANQVSDGTLFVPPGQIGSFTVAIPLSLVVTNTNDAGAGSLRQAILDTNAAATADTITFQAGLTGTITLTSGSGPLAITDAVTITGPGAANLTISGNGATRVLSVNSAATNAVVNVSGLTVTGGTVAGDGGGILSLNDDVLNLDGVRVVNNTVTGAGNQGGGIWVGTGGFMRLANSTVSGNTAADDGGGVYFNSGGGLTVLNSTVSGNASGGTGLGGGGIYFFGIAAATNLPAGFAAGTLTFTNSTISGNTAATSGGGVVLGNFTGTAQFTNCTIAGNTANGTAAGVGGGGVARTTGTGAITVQNSVVSGNTNANGPDILGTGTGAVNVNFSLVGSATGFTPSGTSGNNVATGTDPLLGPLADNGGPTQTRAITTASPLYNAGSNALVPAGVTTDQRGIGFPRPAAGTVDIGAFEFSIPNTPPVVTAPGTATVPEDAATPITGVSVSDANAGDTLTVTLTATNGTLAATGAGVAGSGTATVTVTGLQAAVNAALGTLTYTPTADYNGAATVTVAANDGNGGTDTETINVTVTPVNDGPTANPDALPGPYAEDAVVTVPFSALTGNDSAGPANESGQTLTVTSVGGAVGGTVAIVGTDIVFTPFADYSGPASFTYTVTDSGSPALTSAAATVTFTITPVNDDPTLDDPADVNATITIPQTVNLSGITPGGGETQTLTVTATSSNPAVTGVLTVNYASPNTTGTLTFTPAAAGTATITVTVSDGVSTFSQTLTVVVVLNQPPVVTAPATAGGTEDGGSIAITGVSVADADLITDAYTATVTASAGTLAATGAGVAGSGTATLTVAGTLAQVNAALATLTFSPGADGNGSYVVDIAVTDFAGDTSTASVAVTVTAVNDAPTFTVPAAAPDAAEDGGPQTVTGFVAGFNPGPATATDEAGQTATYAVTGNSNPGLFLAGPAIDAAGNLTYTLAPDAFGTATITVVVTDSGGASSGPQQFTITVTGVNDAPTAANDALAGPYAEDAVVTVPFSALTGNDTAGPGETDTLTVVGVGGAVGGTVAIVGGAVVFTPFADFTGPASFVYAVTDTGGATATGTVTFTILPVNDGPTLDAVAGVSVAEDAGPTTVALTGITAGPNEAQALTVTATSSNPALTGTVAVDYASPNGTATLRFTPAANATGTATVTVTVTDAAGATTTQTFTVTVTPVNDAPAALADTVTVARDVTTAIDVLANDTTAPDSGETLLITAITQPAGGSVAVTGGGTGLSFTPAAGFSGVTSFTYTVSDGNGGATTATVTVTVPPAPTDTTAPTVVDFRAVISVVGSESTEFAVRFSEPVNGLDVSDFAVVSTGLVGARVLGVRPSPGGDGTTYIVTVATGDGTGTLALQLSSDGTVGDPTGNRLAAGATSPTVQVFRGTTPVPPAPPAPPIPVAPPVAAVDSNEVDRFAVGSGPRGAGTATLFGADGSVAFTVSPFGAAGETTGVRVVSADVTGDGVPDLVAGTGPGVRTGVAVYSGSTRGEARRFQAFEDSYTGGVQLAAGDVNGDGVADIAVSADSGGSGRVQVRDGRTGGLIADFFGIDDPNFRGGARVSFGDITGDSVPDLAVAAGTGGGPRIALYDGASIRPGQTPRKLVGDFFIFEEGLRNGATVTLGDLTGDGRAEVIGGGGPGGGPRVLALNGAALIATGTPNLVQAANFFAGDPNARQGVTLSAKDFDDDNVIDIVAAAPDAAGAATVAKVYLGRNVPANGTPTSSRDLTFQGGVFVG